MTGTEGRPSWWTPRSGEREVLLSLAATPGRLPAAVATRLAEGRSPASLLGNHSPDPGAVAAQLDALGLRFLVPGDDGWPLAATPPDPPCAWLFVDGPAPPEATASVAVVGGRRASPLRRAAARSIGAGLARAGYRVVSGGAAGVDAAAHAGALDAGGITVVVLGCGLDVPYPRVNLGLFAGVRAAGGTLASEHPPGTQPRAANFLPRNRLIAALSAAVVVVEAAEDSGSLSTARAAGSRGVGHVLVLPGAPWDPGAAGCNQLIRDGATLVRSLADILEELGATFPSPATTGTTPSPATTGTTAASPGAGGRHATDPGAAGGSAWSGLDAPARAVLTALIDGQLLSPGRLVAAADLSPAVLDSALLDLELAGLIRRTTAGVQAVGLPRPRTARPPRPPNPEGDDSPPGAAGTGVPGTRVAGTRVAGTRAAGTEATSTGPTGTDVAGTRAAGTRATGSEVAGAGAAATGSAGAGAAGPGGSPGPRGPP